MIPVLNLKKLREFQEQKSPAERKRDRDHMTELLQAAIRSTEEYKRICEEKGIPYIPCVAADPYGTNYYTGAKRSTNRMTLGDIWNK